MGKQVVGTTNEEVLQSIIGGCSFRALKSDWRKDLPPQNDVLVHLEMTAKQHRHYDEMMNEFFTIIDGLDVPAQMVLTQMDKLRQISSCIAMHKGELRAIETPANNPKIVAAKEIIENGPGKVVIVYTYKQSGEQLYEALKKCVPAVLKGGMTDLGKTAFFEKNRFNMDPSCRVLIAQQSAACMGHTLLGGEGTDRCSRMIFYEDSFSLRDFLQMRDRNHRGEQDQPCYYYHLVTSPMDQTVINALVAKKSQSDAMDDMIKTVRRRQRGT